MEFLEPRTLLAVGVLDDFAGMEFPTVAGEASTPPDTDIAVGPSHVVETVNRRVVFYSKHSGAAVFEQPLDDFFAPAGAQPHDRPGGILTGIHPKVAYDELSERFVVIALENAYFDQQTSHLLIGVSDDSNPVGNWELQRINVEDADKYWADWPALGWDADGYYVTLNMFSWGQDNYHHHSVLSFDKSSLLDNDPSTLTYFDVDRNAVHDTMWPALMHGAEPGDPMYFVEDGPDSKIRITRMTDKLTEDPTFADFQINVPKHTAVPNPTQPGGADLDLLIGTRILSAAWRNDRLVTAHHVGSDGVARARWYELDTSGAAPTLVQSGQIDPGPDIHTFLPSIDIAPNGDLGMSYVQSSSHTNDANGDGFADGYLSMYITGRKVDDPIGTMQTPMLVKAGEAPYAFSAFADPPPYRVGDFSGTVVDPIDGTFWAANEYATDAVAPPGFPAPFGNWGTWIANFSTGEAPSLDAATAFWAAAVDRLMADRQNETTSSASTPSELAELDTLYSR